MTPLLARHGGVAHVPLAFTKWRMAHFNRGILYHCRGAPQNMGAPKRGYGRVSILCQQGAAWGSPGLPEAPRNPRETLETAVT